MGGMMTIRILSIKPPREVIKKAVCKNCGARLVYTPNDVEHVPGCSGGYGEYDSYDRIICPNCQKGVIVNEPQKADPMHWYK
jgi:DNA-directed RNA polymerase subunit RPC12/RpoP